MYRLKLIIIFIFLPLLLYSCEETRDSQSNLKYPDSLYIVRRPSAGESYIIDMQGENFERKIIASTLQGAVNRKMARLYIIYGEGDLNRPWEKKGEAESSYFWIDYYSQNEGIEISGEVDLESALKIFGDEINGYIIADVKEPWSINAATTLSALNGKTIVGFESEREILKEAGLKEVDNLKGRWKNEEECYNDLFENLYHRMPHRGIAILNPEDYRLRDFIVQQGLLTIYGKPTSEIWQIIYSILRRTPPDIPVYGYLSSTGEEEFIAVKSLSENGKYLIPSDTTPNLSFHLSVFPGEITGEKKQSPQKNSTVNIDNSLYVSLAISDGDNLVIPLNWYSKDNNWNSLKRGKIPVGWSFSPALFSLAPSIAQYYQETASNNDELVGMLGIGYALSTYYPDKKYFLTESFKMMSDAGLKTFWVIDLPLYLLTNPVYDLFSKYSVNGFPKGLLMGYIGFGNSSYFLNSYGMPVITASDSYSDTPQDIKNFIEAKLEEKDPEKPEFIFISASIWSNNLEGLVDYLSPLTAEGVVFLKPSDLLSIVRDFFLKGKQE